MKHLSIIRMLIAFLLALQFDAMAASAGFDHASWDGLLKKNVVVLHNGQASEVDYAGIAAERKVFDAYLASVAAVSRADFEDWTRPAQLAFLLNAYNANTIALVLTGYPGIASIKELGSVLRSPWKKPFVTLLGATRSLDDIEHGMIRGSGNYPDPRVHFALNCASIGCPALRAEAFVAERLDQQLEAAAIGFLADRSRNRPDGGALKVSPIFKWYREDFEKGWRGASTLARFFVLYRQPLGLDDGTVQNLEAGSAPIEFLDYDWHLNAVRLPGKK